MSHDPGEVPIPAAQRRDLLLAPWLAALLPALSGRAWAGEPDPAQTLVTPPGRLPWQARPNVPANSVDSARLFGALDQPGIYYEPIRWHPGYMFRSGALPAGRTRQLRPPRGVHAAL